MLDNTSVMPCNVIEINGQYILKVFFYMIWGYNLTAKVVGF